MQRTVTMPIQYARCVPSGHCRLKNDCARYLVPYAKGRPIEDCSINAMIGYCGDFLPAEKFMGDGKPAKQPTVHEAVKGMV